MKLTEELIADGWIEHDGGPCPVSNDSIVAYRLRGGVVTLDRDRADNLIWHHDSSLLDEEDHIIAYRPEPKQEG